MNDARKTFKAILAVLLVGFLVSVHSWSFAQGGGISGFVKDLSNNQGVEGVIITVKDANIGTLAGTVTTNALGNYSVSLLALGNYTLIASKPGYINMSSSDVVELSHMNPNRIVNISMGSKALLEEKPEETTQNLSWETGTGKSYLIPALEIPAFLFLLNRYDRYAYPDEYTAEGEKVYYTNWSTFRNHVLHGPWEIDTDAFAMNQFNHPYQGSIYHGIARSAGLNYWEALLYDNAGSFLWETAGENTNPSINDQIASGFGGSFFGEALFRMSGLVLEGDGSKPGFWRELGAAVISPPTGFNRLAFGNRFKPIFPSHDPATFWRVRLGVSKNVHLSDQVDTTDKTEATGDFIMAYGLPGKPGYIYTRPFDYFHVEATTLGNSDNPIENIMIRGLLLGNDYEVGNSYCGIWGLYGGYDYISPHIFRVSSTSASLGTTYQWWLSRMVALQGSVLGGVGYAAAGNDTQPMPEAGVDTATEDLRDYHYGIAPQGLLALRLIFANRAMLDLTGRAYYVSGMGSDDPGGSETIQRLNTGLTVRVYNHHAIGIHYIGSVRDAQFSNRSDTHQSAGTVGLVYTYLGNANFGAVEWAQR
jgi:hypothetical protein